MAATTWRLSVMGPVAIAIAFVILDISFALVKKRSGKD
jgi:hypothetical protein